MSDDDRDEQDGPLYLVVTIKPRLDRLAEAEAQLQSMRKNTLAEPGCVFMHFLAPQDDSDTWMMLEKFRSRAAKSFTRRTSPVTSRRCSLARIRRSPTQARSSTFRSESARRK